MCASKDKWSPHPHRDCDGWIKCGRTWVLDAPYCKAADAITKKTPRRQHTRPERIEDDWSSYRTYDLYG